VSIESNQVQIRHPSDMEKECNVFGGSSSFCWLVQKYEYIDVEAKSLDVLFSIKFTCVVEFSRIHPMIFLVVQSVKPAIHVK
jgi:hypothetical protein